MVEPETRPSLMVRLRDPQDQQAWAKFVAIYEPLLPRIMRQHGLQPADAQDVAQQVVVSVSQAVSTWQSDGRQASFRRWLFTIARTMALKFLEQGKRRIHSARRGRGGTDAMNLLQSLPEPSGHTVAEFDQEYRNQVFHWAAEQVQAEVRDSTWQAFWRTCVLQQPIAEVAGQLAMNPGSIYVARSRVIARLRQLVEEFEARHDR